MRPALIVRVVIAIAALVVSAPGWPLTPAAVFRRP
jgi:hypothetical protein